MGITPAWQLFWQWQWGSQGATPPSAHARESPCDLGETQLFCAFLPLRGSATDVMGWETALVECAHPLTRHLSDEHHRCQESRPFGKSREKAHGRLQP
jgi:hypothetical protein